MMSEVRNPNIQRLLSESSQGTLRELQWFGSTIFVLRGPPGTGKSWVISALMSLLFKKQNMKDEIYKLKELCEIRKVVIFSESNNAIDATMTSILHENIFKYSGEIYPVVRVGVNSKDAGVRKLEIETILDAEERIRKRRRAPNMPIHGRWCEEKSFETAKSVLEAAKIICGTAGSLMMNKNGAVIPVCELVVVEEAAHVKDHEMLRVLSIIMPSNSTCFKRCCVLMVGDENQLPPTKAETHRLVILKFLKPLCSRGMLRVFLE